MSEQLAEGNFATFDGKLAAYMYLILKQNYAKRVSYNQKPLVLATAVTLYILLQDTWTRLGFEFVSFVDR